MTDINKAIAFAKECLKYRSVEIIKREEDERVFILGEEDGDCFEPVDNDDQQVVMLKFLANRFSIQINRGTSSLFKWSVIVGLQNRLRA